MGTMRYVNDNSYLDWMRVNGTTVIMTPGYVKSSVFAKNFILKGLTLDTYLTSESTDSRKLRTVS